MAGQLSVLRFVRQRGAVTQRQVQLRFNMHWLSVKGVLERLVQKGLLTRGVNRSYCTLESVDRPPRPPKKGGPEAARAVRELVVLNGGQCTVKEVLDVGFPYAAIRKALAIRILTQTSRGVISSKLDAPRTDRAPRIDEQVLAAMNPTGQLTMFWQLKDALKVTTNHLSNTLTRLVREGKIKKTGYGTWEKQ
jgi:DNA-binding MarR family transcriptional regulator